MEKPTRNRTATTDRILKAFEELLAEQGMDGVSITRVTEKAQVSKVLIYRYFGGLEGLVSQYIQSGRVLPRYTPQMLEKISPIQQQGLAAFWSTNALQPFRQMRTSASARQLLKAAVQPHVPLGDTVNQSLDQEFTQLVHQLSLVRGGDTEALSAVVLGGLSYLTIQAQLDRSVMGMDLRSEENWQRVEQAVSLIYQSLARLALDSNTIQLELKQPNSRFNVE
ncbi:TetR/AcrR family transcriptional regulator [Spirosoma aerophilum]